MASLMDEMGQSLYEAFGHMMPQPRAWRASQELSRVSQDLAAIAAAIEIGTRDFPDMGHVAAAVARILGAANNWHARNAISQTRNAARMAVEARQLAEELTALSQRLQQLSNGRGTKHGYSLPSLVHGYTVTRVKATRAAANYCDAIAATGWGQRLRNISN